MSTSFDPAVPPPEAAFARKRGHDDAGTAMPDRAAMKRLNEATAARNSDARMARETASARPFVPPTPRSVPPHPPTPKLADAGDIGQQIVELVRLDRVAGALSRATARIDEEAREITAAAERDNLRARIAEAADAALDAAERKEKVPPTLMPILQWDRDRIDHTPVDLEKGLRTAIENGVCDRALAAVRGVLDEIDAAVLAEADSVLAGASQAHDRLKLAGLSVDVTLDEVVDNGDDGALSAVRLWRSSVSRWDDVQAVRQWVAAVLDRGFEVRDGVIRVVPPPRVRSGSFLTDEEARKANSPQAEARTQGSQWEGSTAPGWLADTGSHEVLRWWVGLSEAQRPRPRGVADLDRTVRKGK